MFRYSNKCIKIRELAIHTQAWYTGKKNIGLQVICVHDYYSHILLEYIWPSLLISHEASDLEPNSPQLNSRIHRIYNAEPSPSEVVTATCRSPESKRKKLTVMQMRKSMGTHYICENDN